MTMESRNIPKREEELLIRPPDVFFQRFKRKAVQQIPTAGNAEVPFPAASGSKLPEPSDELHLLSRISFGATPATLKRVQNIGVEAYIEEQLDHESIDDSKVDQYVSRKFPLLKMNIPELIRSENYQSYYQLKMATIYRSLFSKRQLFEVMVEFWSNHFSIFHRDDWEEFLKIPDDRDVIRKFALTNFRDILFASAHSPAMLAYLDNHVNSKDGPNENYARELLELHTMGADNGYTQKDVEEVARCFTGLSLNYRRQNLGEFKFYGWDHDTGKKQVLGSTIPAGRGLEDAKDVIDILAAHDSTAWFISYKLCKRFITDNPATQLVNNVKKSFVENNGDIKQVLRTILNSNAFWNNKDSKFRRPMEWLMAMFRADQPNFNTKRDKSLIWYIYDLGQAPFEWAPPDGYPDEMKSWANTNGLIKRWNLGYYHGHGWVSGVQDPYKKWRNKAGKLTPRQWVDYLEENLLFRSLSDEDKKTLVQYAAHGKNPDTKRYGWDEKLMVKNLRAMLFNSPYFQYR
jgi:uncharacterized protein (DUF1800 family)